MLFFIISIVLVIMTFYPLERVIRSFKVSGSVNKCVFITGCDSGFGQRLALRLDKLGFPVFAACLTEKGQQYLKENASTRLMPLPLDVTQKESIGKALSYVKENFPTGSYLWAIVNNAGITGPAVPTEMCPPEDFYKTSAVNLFGAIEICRRFLPLLRKSKGRVVNIASVMGRSACASTPYNVTKFGMEGFSDSLRREVYYQGIKVSILEPGFFKTDIINREALVNNINYYYNQADEEVQTAYGKDFVEDMTKLVDYTRSQANPNIDLVIDSLTHAVTSQYPKTRYVVGWDAHLLFVPLSFIPATLADWFFVTTKRRLLDSLKNQKD